MVFVLNLPQVNSIILFKSIVSSFQPWFNDTNGDHESHSTDTDLHPIQELRLGDTCTRLVFHWSVSYICQRFSTLKSGSNGIAENYYSDVKHQ